MMMERYRKLWTPFAAVIVGLASYLRFIDLELKPLHHDEGVNGFFLETLHRSGIYRYDPSNYHGPDLYYFALLFTKTLGLSTTSIRLSVAVFGVLTVILALMLRHRIGDTASLVTALFLAVSPGMVFISRYFIHEMLFVFFSLAIVVAMSSFFKSHEKSRFGKYGAVIAVATAAMLFATKETAFITLGTLIISCCSVVIWEKIRGVHPASSELSLETFKQLVDRGLGWRNTILLCVLSFSYLTVIFFSSFFTHWSGVVDFFRAYAFWTKTGTGDHAGNGLFAYIGWAWTIETAILLISVAGAVYALYRANNRFMMFTAFWSFGLLAAYTIIPYKTPWLMLSFILPMCILSGQFLAELLDRTGSPLRLFGAVIWVIGFSSLYYQTNELNFVRFDDDAMPYVYAHTKRGITELNREVARYAEASDKKQDLKIDIVSPDYWPLPWYLKDFDGAVFNGKFVKDSKADLIIAKQGFKEDELMRLYRAQFKYVGRYPLRPGVDLYLLARRDIALPETVELNEALRKAQ